MPLDADELRPCRWCGTPTDGDTCGESCTNALEYEKKLEAQRDSDNRVEDDE